MPAGKTLIPDQINHLNSNGLLSFCSSPHLKKKKKTYTTSNPLTQFCFKCQISCRRFFLGQSTKSNSGVKTLRVCFFTRDGSMHLNRPNLRDLGLDFFLKREKLFKTTD